MGSEGWPEVLRSAPISRYAAFVHPKPMTFILYPLATVTSVDAVMTLYFSRMLRSHT